MLFGLVRLGDPEIGDDEKCQSSRALVLRVWAFRSARRRKLLSSGGEEGGSVISWSCSGSETGCPRRGVGVDVRQSSKPPISCSGVDARCGPRGVLGCCELAECAFFVFSVGLERTCGNMAAVLRCRSRTSFCRSVSNSDSGALREGEDWMAAKCNCESSWRSFALAVCPFDFLRAKGVLLSGRMAAALAELGVAERQDAEGRDKGVGWNLVGDSKGR